MSKTHQHEAQNVHSASVCSKVKIAISFYLSQACQRESTSKEQEQNEKLNVIRSEEHTSELQSPKDFVCRLLLEKKKDERHPTHLRSCRSEEHTSELDSHR